MKRIEGRACSRFHVPGASVTFSRRWWLGSARGENHCEMLDLSRGGVRFVAAERVSAGTRVHIEVELPGDGRPLMLSGRVRRSWRCSSHRFDVAVQFEPYGDLPGANPLTELHRLVALETRHSDAPAGWGRLSLATSTPDAERIDTGPGSSTACA